MNAALAAPVSAQPSQPAQPFVHLHVHSAFSLLEGAIPLASLIDMASNDSQPALAVTDRSNLFGALEYSEKSYSKGLQPIVGCTLEVDFEVQDAETEHDFSRGQSSQQAMKALPILVLLASNEEGYANLAKLVSLAYLDGEATSRSCIHVDHRVVLNVLCSICIPQAIQRFFHVGG